MINTELLSGDFEAEARSHIETIESAFLDIDSLKNSPDLINAVFRAAHSLKGTAGFFSYEKIVVVTHELESMFALVKQGRLAIDEEVADVAMLCVDCLNALVDGIDGENDIAYVLGKLRKYSANIHEQPEGQIDIPFDLDDERVSLSRNLFYINVNFNRSLGKYYRNPELMTFNITSVGLVIDALIGGNPDNIVKEPTPEELSEKILEAIAELDTFDLHLLIDSVLPRHLLAAAIEIDKENIYFLSGDAPIQALPEVGGGGDGGSSKRSALLHRHAGEFSIRMDISRINALMDFTEEMILVRNRLLTTVSKYINSTKGLSSVLRDIDRLTSEIQEMVMMMRMQPVGIIFGKFPRIVRDTAKLLDKEIGIDITGEDVMLDKYLLDSLTDPITQIVKNSADHGIEPAEQRISQGKPLKGTISLKAYLRDGFAVIEIADDGAGINISSLRSKIVEKGVVAAEEANVMPDSEVLNMVFKPGISTAKQITSLSGRGVGMDIVKTNLERLGGSVTIFSEECVGTTIRLKTPLTLSVIRVLVITVDSVKYAVPEINAERVTRNTFSLKTVTMDELAVKPESFPHKPVKAEIAAKYLIMKSGNKRFALLIDDAVETLETHVNTLPVFFKNSPCYSGVTVLGDGCAVMILNAEGIADLIGADEGCDSEAYAVAREETDCADKADKSEEEVRTVVTFAFDNRSHSVGIDEIARIEPIEPGSLSNGADGCFANINGISVRIVNPDDYEPIAGINRDADKFYVLPLKKGVSPIGFLAERIIDVRFGDENVKEAAV